MDKYTKIGIVVAMEDNVCKHFDKLYNIKGIETIGNIEVRIYTFKDKTLYLTKSGIGEVCGSIGASLLILKYGAEVIVNFGFAGSLKPDFGCLDFCVVGELAQYDFTLNSSDIRDYGKMDFNRDGYILNTRNELTDLAERYLNCSLARIVTGNRFINDSDTKKWLVNQFDGDICDMESMGLYMVCKTYNIPLLMIKCVSDNADEDADVSFDNIIISAVEEFASYIDKVLHLI